ncbi:MAG: polysaccharide export protein [Candidatus Zixiibacteriota bacterium]|nr:MAG: polysaccharide export protein [candidate division Zixibacteria bacterium]
MKRSVVFTALLTTLLILAAGAWANQAGDPQEDENYRIRPGDQLHIYVHENADLTMNVTVLGDGSVSYPLVGNLYVEGLTVSGLEDILTEKLGQYLQRPVVVITIGTETLNKIYIMGHVRIPGDYSYAEGRRLTDYLAMAGGPDEVANLKKCNVYSKDFSRPRRVVNLKDILDDKDRSQDIELEPNDTVFLERRSGFLVTNWAEIGQIFGIIVGATTLYFIADRNR